MNEVWRHKKLNFFSPLFLPFFFYEHNLGSLSSVPAFSVLLSLVGILAILPVAKLRDLASRKRWMRSADGFTSGRDLGEWELGGCVACVWHGLLPFSCDHVWESTGDTMD
ncbi:hypothetical protein CC78DRAFT_17960 [Lojkania enalia]|uniref:Uncharacterized protein n=1 Tax=Lojkania enalia TaxID=147567 RepID=A0A9P4KGC4_9PLEO|nr:hypothetical protein CC78DRAFT_17960 [Didymosphaeria enalia]